MEISTVLFDLDGTITDSGSGIINSVKYALKKAGRKIPPEDELRKFIGPPLQEQFMKCCGIEEKEAAEMVALYREYYQEEGIFDNRIYDGVMEMLKTLKEAGLKIVMATSKPEKFAKMIAEHFGFAKYFDLIGGACMDGARTKKQEVIQYVLGGKKKTGRKSEWLETGAMILKVQIEKESVPSVFCTGTDRKKNWRKRELTGLQRHRKRLSE